MADIGIDNPFLKEEIISNHNRKMMDGRSMKGDCEVPTIYLLVIIRKEIKENMRIRFQ